MCCLKKLWGCVVTLVVLVLVAFAAFTLLIAPAVVTSLENTVRKEFALAEDAVVSIRQGPPPNALLGKFDFLMLKADDAEIDGLAVEDLLLRADNVSVDIWSSLLGGKAEITAMGQGFVEFKVGADPLIARWGPELESGNLKKPTLELDEGLAKIGALFSIGPLEQRVTISGKVEPTEDGEVRFSGSNLEIAGANINLELINAAVKTLDPVVDLGELNLDVDIRKVVVDDGYIYVAASSEPMGAEAADGSADEQAAGDDSKDIKSSGGLLERFRSISLVDQEERQEQLAKLYEDMKEQGVSTTEQVKQFSEKHLAGLQDEYRWLLTELNQVVESQLEKLDEASEGGADAGQGEDEPADSGQASPEESGEE